MRLPALLLAQSRSLTILATLAGLLSGASNAGLLMMMNRALMGPSGAALAWAFLGLCLIVPVTRIASELLLLRLGQASMRSSRTTMSRRILAVRLRDLERLGAARLNAVLTSDIPMIATAVGLMPVLVINLAVLASCLVYLGLLSWKVLLATLFFIALGIAGYQLPVTRATRHFERAVELGDVLYANFRALTEGSKELKLHAGRRRAFLSEVLDRSAADQSRSLVAGQTIYTVASSWGQMLVFVVIGLTLFVAPRIAPALADREVLTGYCLAFLYLIAPLQMLMNALPNLAQAEVALARVEEMGLALTRQPREAEVETAREAAAWTRLELVGVTHVYRREGEDRDFVLGPIDLALEPGELVFLAGGNGSGKTTLAKVLVGLYLPEAGEIRFNHEPVTDATRERYRQNFSAVFSDFFLFEQLLGLAPETLDERARRYLEKLQLSRKVTIESGRLSTTDLSQGQRKRLALLTAYLEDRPIYVFDEWAADQDPYFRDTFYLQLLPELKRRGKTVLVISHDERYYHLSDRLFELDCGKVRVGSRHRPAAAARERA
jgi:putative ATP-binding cassette transporter